MSVPEGASAVSASEPSVNSATGSHHERRRAAVHGLRAVAMTRQNHAAAATTNPARRSSIHPTRFWRPLLAARMYASVCRWTIVRQPDCGSLGRVQADRVMALVRFSDGDAGTRTTAAAPSNRSAFPYRPGAHLAPLISPVLWLPDASAAVAPDPASNTKAPPKPGAGATRNAKKRGI